MRIKIAGFALLQLSALLFSYQRINAGKRRVQSIRSVCGMLEQLRGALESEASPLPELFQTLSKRCSGQAQTVLDTLVSHLDMLGRESFETIWIRALQENASVLDADARRELESLGAVLGRYELSAQLEAISACLSSIRRYAASVESGLRQSGRLTLGLSLSASAMLGILLI